MTDWEDMALEAQLFPWLDSDCMSDINEEDDFFDLINLMEELDEG